jgi:hypothetical protein
LASSALLLARRAADTEPAAATMLMLEAAQRADQLQEDSDWQDPHYDLRYAKDILPPSEEVTSSET